MRFFKKSIKREKEKKAKGKQEKRQRKAREIDKHIQNYPDS